jgi:uncharacterized protein YggE
MLKKSLYQAVCAAALALASLQGAVAAELPSYPFIHARGTGFMYVGPDMGEIDFDVSAYDAQAEKAVAVIQERVLEIRALLAEQGVPDTDVDVRDMRRQIRKASASATEPEYDIKCSIHIVVRDLGKWRDIMMPLLKKQNLDAFAATFGLKDRAKVEAELMGQAVQEATAKADAMAKGFGKRVGAVAGVSSDEIKNLTRSIGLAPVEWPRNSNSANTKRNDTDPADLLLVTAMKMSQSVDVLFRFK